MSSLIISTAITVDAVMTVEDWYVSEGEHDRAGLELFDRAEALVLGRKNYEGLAAFWASLTGPWAAGSTPCRSSSPHGRSRSRWRGMPR